MSTSLVSRFESLIEKARLKIIRYDPSKARPISLSNGGAQTIDKFSEKLREKAGPDLFDYPDLAQVMFSSEDMGELLAQYAKKNNIQNPSERQAVEVPDNYQNLTLNLDQAHPGRELKFFMTTKDEIPSSISGNVWLRVMGLKEDEALSQARKVVPEYRPRSKPGIVSHRTQSREDLSIFNSYTPPEWMTYKEPTPLGLPVLFERLVNHLFPIKLEREYFYDWLYTSLFDRAYVYLILCGVGGSGKNRLKLVMRALHGHANTVDGKRSTLVDRFNSQLADATLGWFDELHYDLEMENVMKEIQNDSIAIERKGVDATRSSKIYSSLAISNNKPRDNYISFDARKFVPLQVASTRLDTVMAPDEIEVLTKKVESWDSSEYDVAFIAQIGRWLQKRKLSGRWPHLEYKGPMFYKLAHTSMSRWQKKAASLLIEGTYQESSRVEYNDFKGYLWSTLSEQSYKKNGDRSLQFPDFSTVKYFFDIFVDGNGKTSFETQAVKGSLSGDFWVKLINKKIHIATETEVSHLIGEESEDGEENQDDLDAL